MSTSLQSIKQKKFTLLDKLNIIQQLIQQLGPQSNLKVIVNDDPMISNQTYLQQQNVVYTYELVGSKSSRKTQNNNILQKLQVMEKRQTQNINKAIPNKQKDKSLTLGQQEQEAQVKQRKQADDNQKTMFRYFAQNIKCFRCKKLGHYDYACLDEFSCSYCTSSQHHSQRCPQRVVCFRCYNFGHMVNDCPSKKEDGPFCQNCKRKHFDKCCFLMKGIQQVKQLFIMDSLYNHENIRCLKCFQYGHYNCQSTEGTSNYYKRPYHNMGDRNQRKQSRQKYHNQNKKHKY